MSDARHNILQRIRRANQQVPTVNASEVVQQRLKSQVPGPQPRWQEEKMTRFISKAEQSAASWQIVKTDEAIVNAVTTYLMEQSLDNALIVAGTALLQHLKWPGELTVETRAATTRDKVVLVEAFAAIAETGSIVMCSSKETPVSLNFLPDHFLCVVHTSRVGNTMEDVWARVRGYGETLPRAINIITGPSRTADVEQIIQMGAHGPRRVHLLLQD